VVIILGGELVSKFKESYLNDNENGVGIWVTCTPHLVKPLVIVIMFPISRSCARSKMNLNLGVQLKTFNN
jgi:hypothetical protein